MPVLLCFCFCFCPSLCGGHSVLFQRMLLLDIPSLYASKLKETVILHLLLAEVCADKVCRFFNSHHFVSFISSRDLGITAFVTW